MRGSPRGLVPHAAKVRLVRGARGSVAGEVIMAENLLTLPRLGLDREGVERAVREAAFMFLGVGEEGGWPRLLARRSGPGLSRVVSRHLRFAQSAPGSVAFPRCPDESPTENGKLAAASRPLRPTVRNHPGVGSADRGRPMSPQRKAAARRCHGLLAQRRTSRRRSRGRSETFPRVRGDGSLATALGV